jgi:hypothetical protein
MVESWCDGLPAANRNEVKANELALGNSRYTRGKNDRRILLLARIPKMAKLAKDDLDVSGLELHP